MKISDNDLKELTKHEERYGDGDVFSALKELQQHRAEKHERRWRKISEGLPPRNMRIQISDGRNVHDGYASSICSTDTLWRPQLTDLPEGE